MDCTDYIEAPAEDYTLETFKARFGECGLNWPTDITCINVAYGKIINNV